MRLFPILILFAFLQTGFSQESGFFEKSFTERTTDQEKFSMYLDSINKYLYRDILIAESAIAECERIIDRKTPLSDSLLFDFVLEKIFFNHSMANPLGAYRIIAENDPLLDSIQISQFQVGSFNYLKGFTYMAVGDLEAAQNTYYENLEIAKVKRDTHSMISILYSLGQLYNDEKDYSAAIQNFYKVLDINKLSVVRPSTMALVYIELGESYSNNNQNDKALDVLQKALNVAEDNDLQVLKSDILIHLGGIYLEKNEVNIAKEIYDKLLESNEGSQDQVILGDAQEFLGELYRAEKKYPQALEIFQNILSKIDSTDLDDKMMTYSNLHEISNERGDLESAYDYLLAYNQVKKKRDEDVKKQKTSYLKIKFDSEQKEKENILLSSKVLQSKTERKLLYSWMALSFLILVVLFSAFYQKGRYSKKLEKEVYNRTLNLKESNDLLNISNQELKEFYRILSHDLKEPLRSIVGFSQLASRETVDNRKAQEYLDFVIGGGEQLERLIESIIVFQKANGSIKFNDTTMINISKILENILDKLKGNYPSKKIKLSYNFSLRIFNSYDLIDSIFKILFDNAIKYNEQKNVSININYYLKDKTHFFEIEDNGIGIEENYQDRIFEMFKRLNDRKNYSGAGMGLSIAKKLIERIDGSIVLLRSKENEGSTFLLSFPERSEVQNNVVESIEYR